MHPIATGRSTWRTRWTAEGNAYRPRGLRTRSYDSDIGVDRPWRRSRQGGTSSTRPCRGIRRSGTRIALVHAGNWAAGSESSVGRSLVAGRPWSLGSLGIERRFCRPPITLVPLRRRAKNAGGPWGGRMRVVCGPSAVPRGLRVETTRRLPETPCRSGDSLPTRVGACPAVRAVGVWVDSQKRVTAETLLITHLLADRNRELKPQCAKQGGRVKQ